MDFMRQQEQVFQSILKKGASTGLFDRLGIAELFVEADKDIQWQIFSSEVPVFEPRIYVDYCAQLSDWTPDYESVFAMKNSVSADRVHYLARFADGVVPFSRKHMQMLSRAFLSNINSIKKHYHLKGKAFHVFDHQVVEQRYGLKISNLSSLLHQASSSGLRRSLYPAFSSIEEVGKSHYQKLHAFLDCLESMKEEVELLIVSPRTLSDMAMLLSQRLSRAATIADLCPNVKVVCYCYDDSLPYRKELAEFYEGQDVVRMSMFMHGTGVMESDVSLFQGTSLAFSLEVGQHYSFIDEKTLKDGSKPHRRSQILRYEDLVEGESYLLLQDSISGLIQYNSQYIFTLKDKPSALFIKKRSVATLDKDIVFMTEDLTDQAIYSVNQSLDSYGFHVRQYMVGFNSQTRQVEWCLELNRSLDNVTEDTMNHVTSLLHTELAFLSEVYKAYYKDHFVQAPLVAFVPLGTFSSLPDRYSFSHLDVTEKNMMIKSLLDLAWQKKLIQCQPL